MRRRTIDDVNVDRSLVILSLKSLRKASGRSESAKEEGNLDSVERLRREFKVHHSFRGFLIWLEISLR